MKNFLNELLIILGILCVCFIFVSFCTRAILAADLSHLEVGTDVLNNTCYVDILLVTEVPLGPTQHRFYGGVTTFFIPNVNLDQVFSGSPFKAVYSIGYRFETGLLRGFYFNVEHKCIHPVLSNNATLELVTKYANTFGDTTNISIGVEF